MPTLRKKYIKVPRRGAALNYPASNTAAATEDPSQIDSDAMSISPPASPRKDSGPQRPPIDLDKELSDDIYTKSKQGTGSSSYNDEDDVSGSRATRERFPGQTDDMEEMENAARLAEAGTNIFRRHKQGWAGKTMPFILQEILNTKEHNRYISWTTDGKEWIIHDVSGFAHNVCPLYFRHANYRSFMQNVRNWGFSPRIDKDGNQIFSHPVRFGKSNL